MTTRHKSFSAGARTKEPVTFDIEAEGRSEQFTAVSQIPGARLLDFIADADSDDGGKAASAIIEFLTDCIVEEDKDRFTSIIRDPDFSIDVEVLASICEFLVTEYTQRPTTAPPTSADGQSSSGNGSMAPVSSTA